MKTIMDAYFFHSYYSFRITNKNFICQPFENTYTFIYSSQLCFLGNRIALKIL